MVKLYADTHGAHLTIRTLSQVEESTASERTQFPRSESESSLALSPVVCIRWMVEYTLIFLGTVLPNYRGEERQAHEVCREAESERFAYIWMNDVKTLKERWTECTWVREIRRKIFLAIRIQDFRMCICWCVLSLWEQNVCSQKNIRALYGEWERACFRIAHVCEWQRATYLWDGWMDREREREVKGEFRREAESLSTEIEWKMCDGRVKWE